MQLHSRQRISHFLTAGILLFVSACTTVGPDYQAPQPPMPEQWQETSAQLLAGSGVTGEFWWSLFADPTLDGLITETLAANFNLKKAEAQIREARAQRIIAAANGSLDSALGGTSSRRSENVSSSSINQDLFQIGFDARWELDLFGGLRRAEEAAEASLAAGHEDFRGVMVSLQAETASTYLNLRTNQNRLATTLANIAVQEKTVNLVQGRFQMGLGNELDLMNAKTQLALTRAALPSLEKSIRQAMYQLAILTGKNPGLLITRLAGEGQALKIPAQLPINLPSELLRRRPDIRAAERRLAAATADIGVATADLFPKFSLAGLLGLQSNNLSDLVTGGSRYWSIGPTISLALFDRGKTHAAVEVRNARRDQLLADYEGAVLNALSEVETALVAFTKEQETLGILEEAVVSGEKAVVIANGLFEAGLSDFLNVLQSEKALYQSQDQRALSQQRLMLAVVAIFKALGGGWQNEGQSPADSSVQPVSSPAMQKLSKTKP